MTAAQLLTMTTERLRSGRSKQLWLYLASFQCSPPLFHLCEIIVQREGRGRAWEALITCWLWWHVHYLFCPTSSPKNKALISVLVGFLECSTDGLIDGQDCQPIFWHLTSQWISCHDPMIIILRGSRVEAWLAVSWIEPSVEHSKKPTSTLIQASFSFFWTLTCGHNGH